MQVGSRGLAEIQKFFLDACGEKKTPNLFKSSFIFSQVTLFVPSFFLKAKCIPVLE